MRIFTLAISFLMSDESVKSRIGCCTTGYTYSTFIISPFFTFIVACGIFLPSLITIISNLTSLCRIRTFSRDVVEQTLSSRRRADDSRRVLLVITVECILSITNSSLSDIVLSLFHCKKPFADDDCSGYLEKNFDLLLMFDLFNSTSNLILHCLCGKEFRRELGSIFEPCFRRLKVALNRTCCCFFPIGSEENEGTTCAHYSARVMTFQNSDHSNASQLFLKVQRSPGSTPHQCRRCHWSSNRRLSNASRM